MSGSMARSRPWRPGLSWGTWTWRGLEPALAAWKEILRGNPVRARQVLQKIIAEPIVMEPLPEVQGYRGTGTLNGGAVLEGTQKYLHVRGNGLLIVQWPVSLGVYQWRIALAPE